MLKSGIIANRALYLPMLPSLLKVVANWYCESILECQNRAWYMKDIFMSNMGVSGSSLTARQR